MKNQGILSTAKLTLFNSYGNIFSFLWEFKKVLYITSTLNSSFAILYVHLFSQKTSPIKSQNNSSPKILITHLETQRSSISNVIISPALYPNPPLSGRLKIIFFAGTSPVVQFAHPLEQSPRTVFSLFSPVSSLLPPSYTVNKATLSPRFAFLSSPVLSLSLSPSLSLPSSRYVCKCGKINCELWNSVHLRPPLCIFTLQVDCSRVRKRGEGESMEKEERARRIHASRGQDRGNRVHGNYTACVSSEG